MIQGYGAAQTPILNPGELEGHDKSIPIIHMCNLMLRKFLAQYFIHVCKKHIVKKMTDDGEPQPAETSARRDRPSRRTAESGPNGLPVFCRSRHFSRSANVYSVPLWDFTSRWLPDELKQYETTRARSSFAPEKRSETKVDTGMDGEAEGEEDEGGDSPDAPSDSGAK